MAPTCRRPYAVAGGFDVSPYQTLLLQQELESFVSSLKLKLFDGRRNCSRMSCCLKAAAFTQWLPVPAPGLTVPANASLQSADRQLRGVTFDDLDAPKQFFNNVKAIRLAAGARGDIVHDWTWETASSSARVTWYSARPTALQTQHSPRHRGRF